MSRRSLIWGLLTLLALAACGETAGDPGAGGDAVTGADGKGDGPQAPALAGSVRRLELEYGAVPFAPGRPNMIAYLPKGLDTSDGVNVVVYLHGWYNCAENLLRAKNGPCASKLPREAYDLPGQLERSGKNAILLIPELAYDQATSEPFDFATENQFIWMIWETLGDLDLSLWDVKRLVVASHSGGYKSASGIVSVGGLVVNEVWLLDSLYGLDDTFEAWLKEDPEALASRDRRFVDLYTKDGGTLGESTAMATRLAGTFAEGVFVDDRAPGAVTDAIGAHGVVFKRSNLEHDPLVRSAFGELLRTSGLPDKPTPE